MKKNKAKKRVVGGTVSGVKVGARPLADRVLIRETEKSESSKTETGIIIPEGADKNSSGKQGSVVAVGPGKFDDGKLIPMTLRVGDRVLFQWGEKVKVGNEEYYLVRESEVLAVLS